MSQKPNPPWKGESPPLQSEAEFPPEKPEDEPKERSIAGLAGELKNQIRGDRMARSEKMRREKDPVTGGEQTFNCDQKKTKKEGIFMKIFKTFSAVVLLGAVSWNGGALGQNLSGGLKDMPEVLEMTVSVSCKNGDVTFTITNKGKAWPRVGDFSVYSTAITKRIHHRRMRLAEGQRVTFRVLGVAGGGSEIGLWVEPSWFKRRFDYDAKTTCG